MMNRSNNNSRRVYVGNLPSNVDERDLEDIFYKYGEIADVDLKIPRYGTGGTPFAFVEFNDPRDADDAVRGRDGYEFDGQRIRVEFPRGGRGGGRSGGGGGFGGGGGGGPHYGARQGSTKCLCIAMLTTGIVMTVVLLAIMLPIILPAVLNKSSSDVNIATDFYSPGDSRLHVFSSFFCESINIEVDSIKTGATLALVDSTPPLTDNNRFNITDRRSLRDGMFRFWQYHLYPGSNISIDVCINSVFISSFNARNDRVLTYLIRGNSNANNPASIGVPREAFRSVTESCPQKSNIKYTVNEEDEYYVLLYNAGQARSGTSVSYSATLQYERFEYALPHRNTSGQLGSFCTAPSGGQCTVDIPYGTGSQQVLVVTTIPEGVDWGENVDVNISCNRRHWAYAVVILLPLLTITAIIVAIVTGICLYCYKYKTRKSKAISG